MKKLYPRAKWAAKPAAKKAAVGKNGRPVYPRGMTPGGAGLPFIDKSFRSPVKNTPTPIAKKK